jgi:predicted regulator of Ras-like GTPase activity (Roadblock/LC7/MglB family)/ActR/RegA family two-component response regulator
MRAHKKNILIVDDETAFLQSVSDGLGACASALNVITAENGKEAVRILGSLRINLVVTDLKMPEMDGFELLAQMSKNYSDIPVIVMTAFGTQEIEERIQKLGVFQYLEKPFDFEVLANMIIGELEAFHQGNIHGITLPGFLQLVEMEKKTCALKVKSEGKIGFLYIQDGTLIDAKTASLEELEAACEIISWEEAAIEIGTLRREQEKAMDVSLSHVLMDAFRIKDEKEGTEDSELSPEHLDTAMDTWIGLSPSAPLSEGQSHNIVDFEKEEEMKEMQEALHNLAHLDGVKAVCLVGRDGFLIDSVSITGMDAEMIGAIASGGFGASESMGKEIDRGAVEMIMLEYENGPVIFAPVGEDAFIVVVAEKGSNLGLIRVKVKKHSGELLTAGVI